MSSKLSKTVFLLTISTILSLSYHEIPYKLKLNSYLTTFESQVGGSSSKKVEFALSLSSPISFFQHDEEYDESSKKQIGSEIELNYYALGSKLVLQGKLIQDSFEIYTSSGTLSVENFPFLLGKFDSNITSFGILGLAPGIKSTDSKNLNESNFSLKELQGKMTKSVFSISKLSKKLDGTFEGTVYFGDKHIEFMTTEGKTVKCKTKYSYAWSCDFKYLEYNNTKVDLNIGEVTLSSEKPFAIFNIDYLERFLNMLPNGICKKVEENDKVYIECNGLAFDDLELKIKVEDNYEMKIKVPDFNNVLGKEKLNYVFTPGIYFSKDLDGAYIPIHWFRDYHILFSNENNSPLVQFHTYEENLVTDLKENKKKEEEKNYIRISKTAFVILCIALGIVFVVLILFLGYIKLSSSKPTHGLKSSQTKKGKGISPSRFPTFDSSLLGTSDDSMPKRLKTTNIAYKY